MQGSIIDASEAQQEWHWRRSQDECPHPFDPYPTLGTGFEYSYRLTDTPERLPALLVGCQCLPAQFNGLGFVAERRLVAPFGGRTRDMIRVLKVLYVCEGTPQLTLSS